MTSHVSRCATLIKAGSAIPDVIGMQTLDTRHRATPVAYESPTGSFVRVCALGAGIGGSVLAGATMLVLPDLVPALSVWFVWTLVVLTSVLVYGVGTVAFRRSSRSQSRRMQRWLKSGST